MKKHIYIITFLAAAMFITACSGDHATNHGKDTSNNQYNVQGVGGNLDTSKTTTTTGDASTIDNSGSGGTMVAKDSSNLKKDSVRK